MSIPLPNFDSSRRKSKVDILNTNIPLFAWNELSAQEVIGSGGFGSVITSNYKGKIVVVKKLHEQHERNLRLFQKEANILYSLDDKRIVKIDAFCHSPPAMMLEYVFFDFLPFGLEGRVSSLKEFLIFLHSEEIVDSFSALNVKIAQDTARGLKFLHDKNVVHRDLKPANILVSNQMYCSTTDNEAVKKAWEKEPICCKLVDFGESRGEMNQTASVCHTQTTNIDRGTPAYMAPELHSNHVTLSLEQMKSSDVWSFGMVLFMLLNPDQQFPYQLEIDKLPKRTFEICKREVNNRLANKQLPKFSSKYSHFQATTWLVLEKIYKKCVDFDSSARVNSSRLVGMLNAREVPVRCRDIPLAVSQSTAVEQHDQLVAEGVIASPHVIPGDATNSCSFLSVLIADHFLEERREDDLPHMSAAIDEWASFADKINNLILTMPHQFNKHRNIEQLYDVHEAYTILRQANLVKEAYEFYEEIIQSARVFTQEGRGLLLKAVGKLTESNVPKVAIYTSGKYIFVIGCRSGRLFIVDSHTISPELGGNGFGILKVFFGKDLLSQRELCTWVWRRLRLSGVNGKASQSFITLEECIRYTNEINSV